MYVYLEVYFVLLREALPPGQAGDRFEMIKGKWLVLTVAGYVKIIFQTISQRHNTDIITAGEIPPGIVTKINALYLKLK